MIVEFEIKINGHIIVGSVYTDNLEIANASLKKREKILKEIIKNNIEVMELRVKYED